LQSRNLAKKPLPRYTALRYAEHGRPLGRITPRNAESTAHISDLLRRARVSDFSRSFRPASAARFQPALEVLHPNRMLDFWTLYFNKDGRLTVPDVLGPFIVAEYSQGIGDRLVQASGTHIDSCVRRRGGPSHGWPDASGGHLE
jgi:hypothetical protein